MKKIMTTKIMACLLIMLLICTSLTGCLSWYSTTNLADYGVITGNGDNSLAQELFNQLFPAKIESYFEDVRYSYKAGNVDSWDFEIYLEFTIKDTERFQSYVRSIAPKESFRPFEYSEGFLEYVIHDHYLLDDKDNFESCRNCGNESTYHNIDAAQIAKVLVHSIEQRIIYIALGVHDGGGARCSDFTCYFDRFEIDPAEYERYNAID